VAELGKRLDTIHLVMNRIQPKLMRRLRTTIDDAMDERGSPCWASSPKIPRSSWPPYTSKPLILFSRKGAAIAYLNIAKRIMGSGSLMKIR
jgi:septum site-determining protein MinD